MESGTSDPTAHQRLLGHFNFSTGRPDPRIQADLFALWSTFADAPSPRMAMFDCLDKELAVLQASVNSAFQDVSQVQAVLEFAFRHVPAAYRRHHIDLLYHLNDLELFSSGFLVRAVEAVLVQQGPWDEGDRIIAGSLKRLNDYVGHRPVAVLESRPRGEPYDHERVCTMPLFLRGAGVAPGKYAALVSTALDLLRQTPAELLLDACFEFDQLDELSLDPRAYDHNHPADKRPNYRFGEWDPQLIDNRGYYRRLVMRQTILDGLLARVDAASEQKKAEMLHESAAVLAGTILMASGISGAGPETHDSSVTLGTLMPRIASYRDAFYDLQLERLAGPHREQLRKEADLLRQPFGGARQHINQYLAHHRAAQMQQRRLALLIAELGHADSARQHALRVPAVSLRLLAEIHIHLADCQLLAERGKQKEAADELAAAEEVMHRAIACGAMVDPWNILGFQGLFPLFNAREDSVSDHRIGELVQVVDRILNLYARLRTDAAATGDVAIGSQLAKRMEKLAAWWDRFATTTVNDVPHVVGKDAVASATHVAKTLGQWRERGETSADLAFWRKQLDHFRTAKSFLRVVEELLRKEDYRAAMALLVNWLSQAGQVPLEEGEHSFHMLALRWMMGVVTERRGQGSEVRGPRAATDAPPPSPALSSELSLLVRKFIDYLEANAEDFWHVPRLESASGPEQLPMPREHDEEDALYGAAYEGVTFKDSADDGTEGEVLGFEPRQEFELDHEIERLESRLRFLATVARLFHIGGRFLARDPGTSKSGTATSVEKTGISGETREVLESWLARAGRNYLDLLTLLDAIHDRPIPSPSGSYDSIIEFDRRNFVKQRLLNVVLGTCLESALAVGGIQSLLGAEATSAKRPRWEPPLLLIERALWAGDPEEIRRILPQFLEHFQHEPLLYTPLTQGGHPRLILRAGIAQTLLRALVANLPRLGLLRETYSILRVAQTMEREQKLEGPRITEFDRLFQMACQASVEAVAESLRDDPNRPQEERIGLLGKLTEPYLQLWAEHSRTVRMSILDAIATEDEWSGLRAFVRKYGRELFHARFMTLGNLRGILQGGVGAYLKHLQENADPQGLVSLLDDLDHGIPRGQAEHYLQVVLQAVVDNYEEYRDYNTTTAQSDYGENLHVLLDFLRLKAAYDRQHAIIRPLAIVHEVLARQSNETAVHWQGQVEQLTATIAEHFVTRLNDLERDHGIRLRTVADRLRERFVQPMALDRVVAMIEPAYDEGRAGHTQEAFEQLERGLQSFLKVPAGAGLDAPAWLRRLENELQRVRMRRTAMAQLAENMLQVPRIVLPIENIRQQLNDWPKP